MFNGESGYLDHALGTASMAAQVTGVTDWHINPDEPTVLDYNVELQVARTTSTRSTPRARTASSDHDPVIVGLQLNHAPTADAGGPYTVAEGGSVTVTATGPTRTATRSRYAWDLDNDGEFDDAVGADGELLGRGDRRACERGRSVSASSDGDGEHDRHRHRRVTNVAPTATFNAPASAFAGFPFTLSLTNATDAAPADRPGLMFAFDCGSGYGAFSASSTATCPTDAVGHAQRRRQGPRRRRRRHRVPRDGRGHGHLRQPLRPRARVRRQAGRRDSLCDKLDAAEAKKARTGRRPT